MTACRHFSGLIFYIEKKSMFFSFSVKNTPIPPDYKIDWIDGMVFKLNFE